MFWRKSKKDKEKEENELLLRKLNGREVKYITYRKPGDYNEIIIGKDGYINITEKELIITCKNDIVFRHSLDGLEGAELMSLDGINLRYMDEETGEQATVVAYYKYHRK